MARTRGCVWLVAGLLVALLAGAVGFVIMSGRAAPEQVEGQQVQGGTTVKVVVAAQAVPAYTVLAPEIVTTKDYPVQLAPPGYVADAAEAAGKMTTVELAEGEVLLAARLVTPDITAGDGRLALVMSEDQVLMAFPANDLMNSLGVLKPGDHVDLLFSMTFPDRTGGEQANQELVTFKALENQVIAAIVGGQPAEAGGAAGQARALLLTVDPQDALTLKFLKDSGATMDVVLRKPGAEQPYDTTPVDVDRMIEEYRIPAQPGQ